MFKVMYAAERATSASPECYEFIMGTEGGWDDEGNPKPRNRAFQDPGDPVTVGFGHTGPIRIKGEYRKPMVGEVISTEYAKALFLEDIQMAEDRVDKYFMHDDKGRVLNLSQGMRDALVSFCFNSKEKWLRAENNTWVRHMLAGTLTFDILSEWLPKYRNPRTVFEKGLYRRRLWELCRFFGFDPIISRIEAWKAELWRDKHQEIKHRTDPLLVVLSVEAAEKAAKPPSPSPVPTAASKPPAPVEDDAAVATETPEAEEPVVPRGYEESDDKPSPEPVESEEPVEVVEVEPDPGSAPVPAPRQRKHVPYPKPPEADPAEQQMTRPEFWSMNLLLSGRLLLGLGIIPAAFTDLVTDPNFIATLAGVGVIYGAMFAKWRAERSANKKRDDRRNFQIKEALDALRSQVDAGLIDFEDYEAEVRDLMKV